MKPLFNSRSARHSFLTLLGGTLLIFIAGFYIISVFIDISKLQETPENITRQTYRAIRLAKALPKKILPQHVHQLEGENIRVSLSDKPLQDSRVIYRITPNQLYLMVKNDRPRFKYSIPLSNGRWLNIKNKPLGDSWLSVGFLSAIAVLTLGLLALFFFTVKRLSAPLSEFSKAAKQFGRDINAPPLAVTGSSEAQQAATAFNEMQSHIRRIMHERKQILAAVSHDLRTPITRLQLRLEYLKGTPHFDKAIRDIEIMNDMIASILSFARDNAQNEPMERFDFSALLNSLCDDMMDMGRQVTYHSTVDRLAYFGRLSSLRRALTNFIDNAIKYGKTADVGMRVNKNEIQIKIADQGPGIPEDQLEKVFEPFYRVDPARSPQVTGAGIGMTLAREIIRSHGGDVTLRNRQEAGLSVMITLPVTGSA